MEQQEDNLYCPKCGSSHLTANKKGYRVSKAAAGAIFTGGIGLLAGFIGSGNIKITCLKCGNTCKPGELKTTFLYKPIARSNPGKNNSVIKKGQKETERSKLKKNVY